MNEEKLGYILRGRWLVPYLWGLVGFITPVAIVAVCGCLAFLGLAGLWFLGLIDVSTDPDDPDWFLLVVASAVIPLYVAWIALILYLVVRRRRASSKPARNRWEE